MPLAQGFRCVRRAQGFASDERGMIVQRHDDSHRREGSGVHVSSVFLVVEPSKIIFRI